MSYRLFSTCCLLFSLSMLAFGAADKKLPIDETSNDVLAISVSAPLDKDQVKQELGSDLGDDIIVIRLTARPVSDKPVQLSLDDFLLVSSKDGQRSEPYAPGQLAGSDSLAVTPNGMRRGLGDHPGQAGNWRHRYRRWRGRKFRRHSTPGRESGGNARRHRESSAGRAECQDPAREGNHGANLRTAVLPGSG